MPGSKVIRFPNSAVLSDEEQARREARLIAQEPGSPERVLQDLRNSLEGFIYTTEKAADEQGLGGHPEVRAALTDMKAVVLSNDPVVLQAGLDRALAWIETFFGGRPPPSAAIAMPRPR